MENYVAYHSSRVMGDEYRAPARRFTFLSRKSEKFLRGSFGARVWVIASSLVSRRTEYRLEGVFCPERVRPFDDWFEVSGDGMPFRPPLACTDSSWFTDLFREQNRFSYGFNRIQNEEVIDHLNAILRRRRRQSE